MVKIQKAIDLIDDYMKDKTNVIEKKDSKIKQDGEKEDDEEDDEEEEDPVEKEKNGGIFISKIMDMFGEVMKPKKAIDNPSKVIKKINGVKITEYKLYK